MKLPRATADTFELIRYSCRGLERIYKPRFNYKKAGVIVTGIVPEDQIQSDLFRNHRAGEEASTLMELVDRINMQHGLGTIYVASAGIEKPWQMRNGKRSPAYTTRWEELPIAKARTPISKKKRR